MAFNPFRQAELDLKFAEDGWDTVNIKFQETGLPQEIKARVLRNSVGVNPDTGEPMIVPVASITVRISSLDHVPAAGEATYFSAPETSIEGAEVLDFLATETRPEQKNAIGFMTFYPQRVEQS